MKYIEIYFSNTFFTELPILILAESISAQTGKMVWSF
jgi:hypothetical protein